LPAYLQAQTTSVFAGDFARICVMSKGQIDSKPTDRPQPAERASASLVREGCRCGAPTSDQHAGRCVAGHPLKGFAATLARRHGLRAADLTPTHVEAREAFYGASVADDGGVSELSQRRLSLHAYRARLHCHVTSLSDAIERFGLFDKRGRLRALWLQRLEG